MLGFPKWRHSPIDRTCAGSSGRGMDVILGAHVGETSLAPAALTVGQGPKKPAIAREGAFEKYWLPKILAIPVPFCKRGIVDAKRWNCKRPGLGLSVDPIEISRV